MIDPNKSYRTRDGRPVRIYATDGSGCCPVHGAVWNKRMTSHTGWEPIQWHIDGRFPHSDRSHPTSLVEVTLADELRDQIPWEWIRDGYKFVAADRNDNFVTWHAHSHIPEPKTGAWISQGGIKEPLRAIKMPHVMGEEWESTLIERPEDR